MTKCMFQDNRENNMWYQMSWFSTVFHLFLHKTAAILNNAANAATLRNRYDYASALYLKIVSQGNYCITVRWNLASWPWRKFPVLHPLHWCDHSLTYWLTNCHISLVTCTHDCCDLHLTNMFVNGAYVLFAIWIIWYLYLFL